MGKITAAITGVGEYLPDYILTNEELSTMVDTSDEWIMSHIGVKTRHILKGEGVGSSYMGARAVINLLDKAGVDPMEIDLVICATVTPDMFFPSTGNLIADQAGCKNAFAYDVSAACSGFLFALTTGAKFIESGSCKKVVVVGADKMSSIVDYTDRSTCVLFGDGAGAAVVTAADHGMEGFVQWSDGVSGEVLTCPGRKIENPWKENDSETEYIQMNGQEVFRFAVKKVPECIRQVTEKTETQIETIDWFILHQANSRIIQSVAKRLGVPEEKFPMNMEQYGNTSAASIPILLDEMNKKGMLQPGQKIILSGFGAGLTWGAAQIEW